MDNLPLVSVPVVTYNSSKYVLETLESIKAQTYQNIELIVSDDCSTDDTVQLCRDWMEKNKSRFVRTQLIVATVNTGVSAKIGILAFGILVSSSADVKRDEAVAQGEV